MHNEIKKPPLTRWFFQPVKERQFSLCESWRFLELATGKAAQRCLWQMQQAAFKAAPRLAATNVAAGRLAQRGHSRVGDEARSRRSAPRHARGHQNVPPARFSRFARALFEPRPASFQKETPSFRMVFLFGAGDEARTRYLDLGKVALYQMSYARKRKIDCSTRIGVCQSRTFSFSSKSL